MMTTKVLAITRSVKVYHINAKRFMHIIYSISNVCVCNKCFYSWFKTRKEYHYVNTLHSASNVLWSEVRGNERGVQLSTSKLHHSFLVLNGLYSNFSIYDEIKRFFMVTIRLGSPFTVPITYSRASFCSVKCKLCNVDSGHSKTLIRS